MEDGNQIDLIDARKKSKSDLKNIGAIKKNIFDVQDIEDIDDLDGHGSPIKILETKKNDPEPQSQQRQSKRKIRNMRLKPMSGANPQIIQIHQVQSKKEEEAPNESLLKKQKRKKNTTSLKFEIQSDDDDHPIPRTTTDSKMIIQIQSQEEPVTVEEAADQNNFITYLNQDPREEAHSNVAEQEVRDLREGVRPRQIKIGPNSQFIIRRDNMWLNKLWPEFHLHHQTNNSYCFSAKMTGNNKETTFTICEGKTNFVENSDKYLGKVKANFTGSVINVYGPGYNPSDHKTKNLPARNLLATIQYETNFFGSTRPRNFEVYVLKKQLNYYEDLEGTKKGNDEIPLNQLYDIGDNNQKIILMQNRKPQWNPQIKGFMLNFGGRVKKPSIKNFILEDKDNPETVRLIFGKTEENQFRLDIANTLDPMVGFGIALSTFGGKIGCE